MYTQGEDRKTEIPRLTETSYYGSTTQDPVKGLKSAIAIIFILLMNLFIVCVPDIELNISCVFLLLMLFYY